MRSLGHFLFRSAATIAAVGSLLAAGACGDATGPNRASATQVDTAALSSAVPKATRDSAAAANNIVTAQDLQMAVLSLIHAVQPCLNNGWTKYKTSNGIVFKNVLECAIYAALGGRLVPIPPAVQAPPVIVSFTLDGVQDQCAAGGGIFALFTPTFTGGTGTLTVNGGSPAPVSSGVQLVLTPAGGTYTLTVTNSGGSVSSSIEAFGGEGTVLGCPAITGINLIPTKVGKIAP